MAIVKTQTPYRGLAGIAPVNLKNGLMSIAENNSSSFESPVLTAEQRELRDLLQNFFSAEFPLAVARRCYEAQDDGLRLTPGAEETWKTLSQLGLEEAFLGNDSLGFIELAIVAQGVGGCCLPAPLTEQLYFSKVLEAEGVSAATLALTDGVAVTGALKGRLTGHFKPRQTIAFGGEVNTINLAFDCNEGSLKIFRAQKTPQTPVDRSQGLAICDGDLLHASSDLHDIERHERLYRLLKAGEALGAADHAVRLTRSYMLDRKQFGVQIATFQALQHKLADMYRYVEQMQSLYRFAAWTASSSVTQEPLVSLAAIKFIYNHAVEVIEGAIQLHGGIGFTWEYDLHLLLRRAKMNETLIRLSDTDHKLMLKSSC